MPVSNPLDLTAQGLSEPALYTRTLEALLGDDRVGTIMAGIIQSDPVTCAIKFPPILDAVRAAPLTKALPLAGLETVTGVVPEYRAKALLALAGVPFPQGRFAASADSAVTAADAVGYPVAMKAQAAALGHKSDAGGVLLNLADGPAVHAA